MSNTLQRNLIPHAEMAAILRFLTEVLSPAVLERVSTCKFETLHVLVQRIREAQAAVQQKQQTECQIVFETVCSLADILVMGSDELPLDNGQRVEAVISALSGLRIDGQGNSMADALASVAHAAEQGIALAATEISNQPNVSMVISELSEMIIPASFQQGYRVIIANSSISGTRIEITAVAVHPDLDFTTWLLWLRRLPGIYLSESLLVVEGKTENRYSADGKYQDRDLIVAVIIPRQ